MSKVKAFRAVTYNQGKFKDLSRLVCPPYDVISPAEQQYYHDLDPYNFIHILLGKDITGDDKYIRARNYFKDWLKDKILITEDKPAVYFYSQQYNLKGEKRTRFGFIALLRLNEKNPSVFAHEHTRVEPKEDRLKLLKAVKANLSPIFVIFADKKRIIPQIYKRYIQDEKPFIEVQDQAKTVHRLWKIDSPDILANIEAAMAAENIFIADGHHRYEVSCIYRDEMVKRMPAVSPEEDYNYTLAYFTHLDPKGLAILPIHRLVRLGSHFDSADFMNRLKEYFEVEEVKDKIKFFFLLEKAGRTEHIIGMYKDKRYWLLRLKNIKILDKEMSDRPKEYRMLDVSILNCLVLNKIIGLDLEVKGNIAYSPDAEELIERVDNDSAYVAFFLNGVKVEQIMAVALKGEKMPPKSTYFYPKVLSGLVVNKHGRQD
jgi:uncharacterized protein (DUF1015 family)